MGWHPVTPSENANSEEVRKRILGRWAGLQNIILNERDGYEEAGTGPFFASADTYPGAPKCGGGRNDSHDYRHFEDMQYDWEDEPKSREGGYVCTADNGWQKKTAKQTCPEYGVLKCVYCGDTYDPDKKHEEPKVEVKEESGLTGDEVERLRRPLMAAVYNAAQHTDGYHPRTLSGTYDFKKRKRGKNQHKFVITITLEADA